MRLHRFYTDTKIIGNEVSISDTALLHQWRNVFRYNVGSFVILFDGTGYDYTCQIAELTYRAGLLLVTERNDNLIKPRISVTLFQSIIKKDNFELVVQKAVELGVTKIVPVLSERSEKKKVDIERLKKIVIEAVEQSGRSVLPEIGEVATLESILSNPPSPDFVLDSSSLSLKAESLQPRLSIGGRVIAKSFLTGPEGGWSDRERELFKSKNIPAYSLGNMTLRAETAAIAGLSVLLLL